MKLSTLSALAFTSGLLAQTGQGLLFSTRNVERTAQCPPLVALCRADANEVELVVPRTAPYTAKAFAPRVGYDLMAGDQDVDATFYEPAMFRGVDAVLPAVNTAALTPQNARALWVSLTNDTPAVVGGTFAAADVGRFLAGGVLERFLSSAQLHAAFGVPAAVPLNVDAIALHLPTGIYLSLEDTVTVNVTAGVIVVDDGAILRIPAGAIAWSPSPYDGALRVAGVAAGSGQVIASEAEVDLRVANSNIKDFGGVPCGGIGDTDGLEVDPNGGFWATATYGNMPNLYIAGERLTGGGVISTNGLGMVAVMNGIPLGNNAGATTGAQVGLVTAVVGSLNGLGVVRANQRHFASETPTPRIVAPGPLTIELGGMDPAAVNCFLFLAPGVLGAGTVDPSFPFPGASFPDLYVSMFVTALPIGVDGCASWSVPVTAAMLGGLAGNRLRFQGYYFDGVNNLSTPLAVQFF